MGALLEHCCLVAQVRRMGLLTMRKAALLDNMHAIKCFQNEGRRAARSLVRSTRGRGSGRTGDARKPRRPKADSARARGRRFAAERARAIRPRPSWSPSVDRRDNGFRGCARPPARFLGLEVAQPTGGTPESERLRETRNRRRAQRELQ